MNIKPVLLVTINVWAKRWIILRIKRNCMYNAWGHRLRSFSEQYWILTDITLSTCEYNFNTRRQHNTISNKTPGVTTCIIYSNWPKCGCSALVVICFPQAGNETYKLQAISLMVFSLIITSLWRTWNSSCCDIDLMLWKRNIVSISELSHCWLLLPTTGGSDRASTRNDGWIGRIDL